MTYSKCPNCQKSIGGMFGVSLISQAKTDFINSILLKNSEAYCVSCSTDYVSQLVRIQDSKFRELQGQIIELSLAIPVVTSQAHAGWEYDVLDMVTCQTTSGTGFLTDISQSINDFFGQGSEATNRKVSIATETCKTDIRRQCLKLGGNAIIATDIDFNEVGSGNTNMLLVCMAGTAIKVRNFAQIDSTRAEKFELLERLNTELSRVSEVNKKIIAEFELVS